MREDLEQQEQLDAIKGFWSENKKWIVPLVALLLIAASSYNGWNWWQNRQAVKASEALTAMESALGEQSLEKARAAYKALSSDFRSSTQAALGGLQMAKALAVAGELAEARTVLQQVVDHSAPEFAWMARIRLAGVMLDENNAKAALDTLSGKPPKEFAALVEDRKGDAHAGRGHKEDARSAWKTAADGLPAASPSRELIMRKLQTLDAFGSAKS